MKSLFQYLVYFALIIVMISCNKPGVEKDMARFDQAYVPTLYFVYKNDLEKAAGSMFLLDSRWQDFQQKYSLVFRNDADEMQRLRYIDGWLCDANDAVLRNDRHNALIQLDHVKYEMMEIRRSLKVEYFLDYLWDFEGALSMLDEAVDDVNNLNCSPEELAFMTDEALYFWDIVKEAGSSSASQVFNTINIEHFEKHEENITEFLKLVDAQKFGPYENFDKSVNQTRDAFMQLLTVFGDFEAVPTFYANTLGDGVN